MCCVCVKLLNESSEDNLENAVVDGDIIDRWETSLLIQRLVKLDRFYCRLCIVYIIIIIIRSSSSLVVVVVAAAAAAVPLDDSVYSICLSHSRSEPKQLNINLIAASF